MLARVPKHTDNLLTLYSVYFFTYTIIFDGLTGLEIDACACVYFLFYFIIITITTRAYYRNKLHLIRHDDGFSLYIHVYSHIDEIPMSYYYYIVCEENWLLF